MVKATTPPVSSLISLRRRFLWLLSGVVGLFIAGMMLSLLFSLRANDAAVARLLNVEAMQAQASVMRRWGSYRELVDNLARDPQLIDTLLVGTIEDRQRWAVSRQRLIPGILGLALVNPDGEIQGDPDVLRVGASCRRDLRQDSTPVGDAVLVHRDVPGLEHIDLVSTVRGPHGALLGKVFVSVQLEQLRHIIKDATQPGHAMTVRDKQGKPVVSSGRVHGAAYEVSAPLPSLGWSLVVQAPRGQLSSGSLMHVFAGMLTLAGVLVLLVVVVVRMRKPIIKEINAALETLASLTRDEAAPPVKARYVEFAPAVIAINRIAQQLRDQREQLATLSLTDTLTDLPNRRAFESQFPHMLGLADRGHAIALVLLDVDHFKAINDRLGHAAGDQSLIALATTLKGLSRSADMIARLAGDEFTVLLSGLDNQGIAAWYLRLSERFKRELNAAGLEVDNTISAGQTWLQAMAGDSIGKALGRADYALYQAKAQGRGRLVLGDDVEKNDAG